MSPENFTNRAGSLDTVGKIQKVKVERLSQGVPGKSQLTKQLTLCNPNLRYSKPFAIRTITNAPLSLKILTKDSSLFKSFSDFGPFKSTVISYLEHQKSTLSWFPGQIRCRFYHG